MEVKRLGGGNHAAFIVSNKYRGLEDACEMWRLCFFSEVTLNVYVPLGAWCLHTLAKTYPKENAVERILSFTSIFLVDENDIEGACVLACRMKPPNLLERHVDKSLESRIRSSKLVRGNRWLYSTWWSDLVWPEERSILGILNLWCCFWSHGILVCFFFKNWRLVNKKVYTIVVPVHISWETLFFNASNLVAKLFNRDFTVQNAT